jgi:hypothetical protein
MEEIKPNLDSQATTNGVPNALSVNKMRQHRLVSAASGTHR